MVKSLNTIYLHPTEYLKLRFTYCIDSPLYKKMNLEYVLEFSNYKKSEITICDLLESFIENFIVNFRRIQSYSVIWEYVSLIYINKPRNMNIIKIPLTETRGCIKDKYKKDSELGTLRILLRFERKPRPLSHKILGIHLGLHLEEEEIISTVDQCAKAYVSKIQIKNHNVHFKIVFSDKQKKQYIKPLLASGHLNVK